NKKPPPRGGGFGRLQRPRGGTRYFGSTFATQLGLPSLICTITIGFAALRFLSMLITPLTPLNPLVAAIALARSSPLRLLARVIASKSTMAASYPSPPRASGVCPLYSLLYFSMNAPMFELG